MKKIVTIILVVLILVTLGYIYVLRHEDMVARIQRGQSIIPYVDAGKSCQNSNDCKGFCVIYDRTEKSNEFRLGEEYISQEKYNNAPFSDTTDIANSLAVVVELDMAKLKASNRYSVQCSQFPADGCDNWYKVENDKVYYNSVLCDNF